MLQALDRGETIHFLKALHPGQSCHPVQWQLGMGQCVSCVVLAVVIRIIRSAVIVRIIRPIVIVVCIIRSAVVVIRIIRSSAVIVSSVPRSCKLGFATNLQYIG
jgi:hypothetical protein